MAVTELAYFRSNFAQYNMIISTVSAKLRCPATHQSPAVVGAEQKWKSE